MAQIVNLRGQNSKTKSGSNNNDEEATSSNPLVESIIEGLTRTEFRTTGTDDESKQYTYTKHIPTMVLYDDKGLDIYDQITQCEEYYLYNSELTILQKHGESIAKRLLAYPVSASKLAGAPSASPSRSTASTPPLSEHALTDESSAESDDKGGSNEDQDEDGEDDSGYTGLPQRLDVKEKWGDASVGRNNFGVNGNLGLGEGSIPTSTTTTSIIELGAGSLKKTSVLLKALANVRVSNKASEGEAVASGKIKYYALDLEYRQLEETLAKLEEGSKDTVTLDGNKEGAEDKIVAKGICASYEEAFPHLRDGSYDSNNANGKLQGADEKKCILFLGSSIGNYSRTEAIDFLRQIAHEGMKAGDTLLIGIDSTDDKPMIENAYNDSDNVTRGFILNGVDHVNQILGDVGLKQEDFEYKNRYNKQKGRHEAYIVPKKEVTFTYRDSSITLAQDELIRIERSYKYSLHEALDLFGSSGLRVVDRWSTDAQGEDYHLWLLEKPGFGFESTRDVIERGENPFGLPTLNEWDRLWKAWDCVTLSMIPQDLLHTKPIDLRHICLFYLGHIPGFLDIHMSRYLKEPYTEPAHFPDMFERGIDPNMDDPSKVHAHSVVPTRMEDWPSVSEIVEYRNRVRARLVNIYETRLENPEKTDRRLARTMAMVYEHEVMHLETLLYMAAQIPAGKLNCAPSFSKPDWAGLSALWEKQVASERRPTRNLVQTFEASTISVGHDDSDHLDAETKYDTKHTFGWDNEAPKRNVSVPAFKMSLLPISNSDYHRFWVEQGRPENLVPGSWTVSSDDQVSIKVLTEPSRVDLDIGKDWPCMASGKQLEAYAKSVGGRLPTEPELRRFLEDHPVDHVGANIGFMNWHPVPARLPNRLRNGTQTGASNGGVWEWTSTCFEVWEGWQASELYPDYSRDFFDGCHWVMLGGSFATIPRVAGRKTFTNWYQANYPYVFAGARVAYDA